jgi:hypothetical protein
MQKLNTWGTATAKGSDGMTASGINPSGGSGVPVTGGGSPLYNGSAGVGA